MLLYALERLVITLGISIGAILAVVIVAKLAQVVRGLCGWFGDLLGLIWARRFLRDIRRCL